MGFLLSKLSIAAMPTSKLIPAQNKRIRRKTDRVILAVLVWVYFLQVRPPIAGFSEAVPGA